MSRNVDPDPVKHLHVADCGKPMVDGEWPCLICGLPSEGHLRGPAHDLYAAFDPSKKERASSKT